MIASFRAPAARARARRLQGELPRTESEWLAGRLSSLALPIDVDAVAERAPAVVAVTAFVTLLLFGVAGVAVLAVAATVVVAVLRRSAPRRRAGATDRALPSVLDAVARNLRAGGSLAQALAAARPPASAPDLHASWARLVDLVPQIGVTAALDGWSSASTRGEPSGRSVHLAAAALSLAATTGGSPARAIDGVAATLRSRLTVADEIRALSSQARASAAVISLAPIVFGVLASATDHRTRGFLTSPSGLVLLAFGLGLDAAGACWMVRLCRPTTPCRRRRRRRRHAEAAIADAVPDVIDLFAVAVAAGLNNRLALAAVAGRAPPGPLAVALARVERDVAATGARLADTIERLPEELHSEAVRPLTAAITDAERYGALLGPTLDRLADDARRTRQRKAEEAARRIPVKLLFPLVTCILPAFGLLTVAPLIAGGLRALRL